MTRVGHSQSTCKKQCLKLEINTCRRGNVMTRARHRLGTCGEHCQSCMEREGACGLHIQNEIHAGVDSIVSKNLADNGVATPRDMRAAPLGDAQMAASERVRVAPPGSIVWTSADSPIEAGPPYRSCTASPQRRRVSRNRAKLRQYVSCR